MIESAKIFILGLLCLTILQNASGSLLNIINVEYSESKFKESGVENGINILSIVVKYTTTDPAKIQATWMKELDDGTLPIYVGDREFITWENKFSIDENVTEVQCYIEYLAPQNPGDDVRSDLDIPEFGTGLKQLNLWISVESNTIVKVLGLDQESKWGSRSSYFSLTKNQDETIGLNDHNTVLRTDLEYSINSNSLNGNGEKGSWFYNTKYGMFSRFAQLPPPDATRLKDGANGTSIQYFAKDSKVQNTLVQEKGKGVGLSGVYIYLLSTENIVLQSSVVVKRDDERNQRSENFKAKPFFVCSKDRLDADTSDGKRFGIAYPKSKETSCIRFLLTNSDQFQNYRLTYVFRNQNGLSPQPIQSYRIPSGIVNNDFIYLFADDEFEMGNYRLDVSMKSPHGYGFNQMFTFEMMNYTTSTVNITKVELTRTYTKVECLVTGNPRPDYMNLYIKGMEGECNSRYTNCEITERPDGTLMQWKVPLRVQQLKDKMFVCEARPEYQGFIKDEHLIEV